MRSVLWLLLFPFLKLSGLLGFIFLSYYMQWRVVLNLLMKHFVYLKKYQKLRLLVKQQKYHLCSVLPDCFGKLSFEWKDSSLEDDFFPIFPINVSKLFLFCCFISSLRWFWKTHFDGLERNRLAKLYEERNLHICNSIRIRRSFQEIVSYHHNKSLLHLWLFLQLLGPF